MRSPDYLAALDLLRLQEAAFADRERLLQAQRSTRGPVLAAAIAETAETCLTEARRLLAEAIAALSSAHAEEASQRLVVVAYDERGA